MIVDFMNLTPIAQHVCASFQLLFVSSTIFVRGWDSIVYGMGSALLYEKESLCRAQR